MRLTTQALWLKRMGPIILVGLFTWSFVLGGTGVRAATDSALRVSPEAYRFGAVRRLGGQVTTTFLVRNQGDVPLKIRRIWTS
jgi:hypothetical protein